MSGKCPVCGFAARLRKDGTIGAHKLYGGHAGPEGEHCKGAGQMPAESEPRCFCGRTNPGGCDAMHGACMWPGA